MVRIPSFPSASRVFPPIPHSSSTPSGQKTRRNRSCVSTVSPAGFLSPDAIFATYLLGAIPIVAVRSVFFKIARCMERAMGR
jgi:hypothetical protein